MVLPAGFPPASFRLEGGCLMYSTTAAIINWSARQDLHLRSLGPKPSMLLLHHALFAPMDFRDRGREKRDAETLGISLAVRLEIGEPGGSCTLNPPADNGALC